MDRRSRVTFGTASGTMTGRIPPLYAHPAWEPDMRRLSAIAVAVCFTAPLAAADGPNLVDPPGEKFDWKPDPKLNAATPKNFFDPEMTFADHGGPFLAIGRNSARGESRAVIDLRNGKAVGKVVGDFQLTEPFALSRDGKRFAGVVRGPRLPEFGRRVRHDDR